MANVIVSFFIPPLSLVGAAINAFISGFLISGGDLKSGLIAGLTAGLMFGIGDKFAAIAGKSATGALSAAQQLGKAFLEGIVGGIGSRLAGGKFKDGFLGAFASSLSSRLPLSKNPIVKGMQMIVIGGTVSLIGGGRFGNGAISGAFAVLFNDMAHAIPDEETGLRINARIKKVLEVGIDTNEGLRAQLEVNPTDTITLKVGSDGQATARVRDKIYRFNAEGALDGAGIRIGAIDVTIRMQSNEMMRIDGKVMIPEKITRFLGIEFSAGGYTSVNVVNAVTDGSGLLHRAARALQLGPFRNVPKELCESTGVCP